MLVYQRVTFGVYWWDPCYHIYQHHGSYGIWAQLSFNDISCTMKSSGIWRWWSNHDLYDDFYDDPNSDEIICSHLPGNITSMGHRCHRPPKSVSHHEFPLQRAICREKKNMSRQMARPGCFLKWRYPKISQNGWLIMEKPTKILDDLRLPISKQTSISTYAADSPWNVCHGRSSWSTCAGWNLFFKRNGSKLKTWGTTDWQSIFRINHLKKGYPVLIYQQYEAGVMGIYRYNLWQCPGLTSKSWN